MTALLPAVFGALIVIGLIGMVYALHPGTPEAAAARPDPHPVRPGGSAGSPGSTRAPGCCSSAALSPASWSRC